MKQHGELVLVDVRESLPIPREVMLQVLEVACDCGGDVVVRFMGTSVSQDWLDATPQFAITANHQSGCPEASR